MTRLILFSIAAALFAASCCPTSEGPGDAVYVEPSK